jgi:hypothetical protein
MLLRRASAATCVDFTMLVRAVSVDSLQRVVGTCREKILY